MQPSKINLNVIKDKVEQSQGVLTVTMGELRDAYGADRLGVHVKKGISGELKRRGLGHFPDELPNYQHEPVRLYSLGGPVSQLIDAVLKVEAEKDEVIRQAAGGKAAETLRKVRELICE